MDVFKTLASTMLLVSALSSNVAHGAIFKCEKDGRTVYQDKPCEPASEETIIQAFQATGIDGCYQEISQTQKHTNHATELWQVRTLSGGKIELFGVGLDPPSERETSKRETSERVPMKRATKSELEQMSTAFGAVFREGVSIVGDPESTPNYRPVGVYKGKDPAGNEIIFLFMFFYNALVRQVPCP